LAKVPPPEGMAWVLGDHTWVTPALLRKFVAACPAEGGRLGLQGPFVDFTGPLQDLPVDNGLSLYPVGLIKAGAEPVLQGLAVVELDLQAKLHQPPVGHPAYAGALQPIPVTAAAVHTVTHWSHLLRVNLLALVAAAETERGLVEAAPWYVKLWTALALVWRARSINKWKLATAVGPMGKNCEIHPTATVEACWLGDNVEIGPHAVVRASWLGDGVKIGEHAQVNLSVVMEKAEISRGTMANICLLMPQALISPGFGHQACVFGRECFVAYGATFFDLSFGGDIKVSHRGERVSSGTKFLGTAVGHRAKVGPHVVVGYGEAIPNDAFLIVDPARIFRRIPDELPVGEPVFFRDGEIKGVGGG